MAYLLGTWRARSSGDSEAVTEKNAVTPDPLARGPGRATCRYSFTTAELTRVHRDGYFPFPSDAVYAIDPSSVSVERRVIRLAWPTTLASPSTRSNLPVPPTKVNAVVKAISPGPLAVFVPAIVRRWQSRERIVRR